jgi:hypothetical protein
MLARRSIYPFKPTLGSLVPICSSAWRILSPFFNQGPVLVTRMQKVRPLDVMPWEAIDCMPWFPPESYTWIWCFALLEVIGNQMLRLTIPTGVWTSQITQVSTNQLQFWVDDALLPLTLPYASLTQLLKVFPFALAKCCRPFPIPGADTREDRKFFFDHSHANCIVLLLEEFSSTQLSGDTRQVYTALYEETQSWNEDRRQRHDLNASVKILALSPSSQ